MSVAVIGIESYSGSTSSGGGSSSGGRSSAILT